MTTVSPFEKLKRNPGHKAIVVETFGTIEGFIDSHLNTSSDGVYIRQSPDHYTFIGKALIKQVTVLDEKKRGRPRKKVE